ncbi:AEC family transporter [Parvularcula dongshanensis]|uniref:AEC family transporter n=1 Tax=Parvularcula dongshanensis TaxID=1173995 RepID=A0A840I4N7_9PROT|nr:AEC family transporter [Parvularcula dongshanensis]MBB4658990.1 hypothetical protein [Parvularcula dongshanensis]
MSPLVSGLIPIAGSIAFGWLLRRSGLVRAELWPAITRLAYQALLPAVLYVTLASTDYAGVPVGSFLGAMTLGFLAMAAISLGAGLALPMGGPTLTSVFQGGLRINGFVVLALAEAAFPPEGVVLVAIMFSVMVPLVNVLAVAVLTIFCRQDRAPSVSRVLSRIATNPLILGCLAGLAAAAFPVLRPAAVVETASLVGRAALPLILLTVGASLDFAALRAAPALLALSVTLKLIVAPLVFWGLGAVFGVTGAALAALMAIGAAPCAASAYVLARELGGNAELMAGHVTATTILAFAALPFWLHLAA